MDPVTSPRSDASGEGFVPPESQPLMISPTPRAARTSVAVPGKALPICFRYSLIELRLSFVEREFSKRVMLMLYSVASSTYGVE
jgi:hypothetical protein